MVPISNIQPNSYRLADTAQGSTEIQIPEGASDLVAVVNVGGGTVQKMSVNLFNDGTYRGGYYSGSSVNAGYSVTKSSGAVALGVVMLNGTNVTTSSTVELWYR